METKSIKDLYPGYFQSSLESIWNDCVLVLDTNVFISLIEYPNDLTNELIKIFNDYNNKSRLFVPNIVGDEVIKQLDGKLEALEDSYNTIDNSIDELLKRVKHIFDSQGKKTYPINCPDKIIKILSKYSILMKKQILKCKEPKKDIIKLRNDICNLLSCVGTPYTDEQKKSLITEIEKKWEEQIIPGYKDAKKTDGNKFNDSFIWYQIKEYSKINNKSILLITTDLKEDWWHTDKRTNKKRPKQPMLNDFMKYTHQCIHIMTVDKFLEEYNHRLPESKKINTTIMNDVLAYVTPSIARDLNILKPKINAIDLEHPERRRLRIDRMKRWFLDRFEDPANMCPYDGKEGGYQYIYGGPYYAYDELDAEFGSIYSEELIKEVVEELESTGTLVWSKIPNDKWTE